MLRYDYETIKSLAKDIGLRVTDLLALASKNDPFYSGDPADTARAAWFADIYQRAGYNENRAPHLRRIHYWTVSQDPPVEMPDGKPYENTQRCWEYLSEASKAARYLELVPMTGIVDNKNPNPHIHAIYDDDDPSYSINTPQLTAPYVWVEGINDTGAQPYHLEIWCEKSTMNDVLLPVAARYNANLVTFEGEVSITSVCVNLMGRIAASGGKPARVFYISDFDPAGNSMPVAMSRKLEYAIRRSEQPGFDVRVNPIALTAALIEKYHLPRIPIKDTERRAGKFEAAFGTGAVELDALEALYPGELARLVDGALAPYYSVEAADRVRRQQYALRQAVDARIQAITSRYEPEIAALQTMIEELEAIDIDASEYTVERFEAEAAEGDNWLYDSARDYVEQIGRYKAHKSGDSNEDDAA